MALADTNDPRSLSSRLRRHRAEGLKALIALVAKERGRVEILDMGGTVNYWVNIGLDYLEAMNARVTIVNLTETLIGVDGVSSSIIKCEIGDACNLSNYQDNQFDLSHSNSVIEHVGTWVNMKKFAAEARRLAPFYYVQTPYFWFPVDPHYYKMPLFHWLPRPTRARLLNSMPIAHVGKIEGVDMAFPSRR